MTCRVVAAAAAAAAGTVAAEDWGPAAEEGRSEAGPAWSLWNRAG